MAAFYKATAPHLHIQIGVLSTKIKADIERLEKLPEMSLSQRAESLRTRIQARRRIVADLERLVLLVEVANASEANAAEKAAQAAEDDEPWDECPDQFYAADAEGGAL